MQSEKSYPVVFHDLQAQSAIAFRAALHHDADAPSGPAKHIVQNPAKSR